MMTEQDPNQRAYYDCMRALIEEMIDCANRTRDYDDLKYWLDQLDKLYNIVEG